MLVKWRLLVTTLPIVAAVAALRAVLDLVLEFPGVVEFGDVALVLTGGVFLVGLMLSGTMADFKESEKLPAELACTLETVEEAMVAALQHQNAQVRILAARQLMKKGVARNVDTVANAALAALEQFKDHATRVALLELIGKMGRPRDVDALVALLSEKPSLEERVALARALDALGDGRGTLSFVEDLQSDKGTTREEAVRALSDITGEPYRPNPAWWQEWWKTYAERYRQPKERDDRVVIEIQVDRVLGRA